MIVGMVPLLSAPFGRLSEWPYMLQHVIGPGTVVIALWLVDLKIRGKVHPVTRFVGIAALAWELVPNLYMNSGWWRNTAAWLIRIAG